MILTEKFAIKKHYATTIACGGVADIAAGVQASDGGKEVQWSRGTRRIDGEYILRENDSHRHIMR